MPRCVCRFGSEEQDREGGEASPHVQLSGRQASPDLLQKQSQRLDQGKKWFVLCEDGPSKAHLSDREFVDDVASSS